MTSAPEKRIAKQLGVTPVGLAILAKASADPEGMFRGGLASGNPGTAKIPLVRDGYLAESAPDVLWHPIITDAGREIVRRARQMGW